MRRAGSFGVLGALALGTLAELPFLAGVSGLSAASQGALAVALMVHGHPVPGGRARVVVGRSVAPANRLEDRRTDNRRAGADPFGVLGALARGVLAELPFLAGVSGLSAASQPEIAPAFVVDRDSPDLGVAGVGVGPPVTATYRKADGWADARQVDAHALGGGVALAVRDLAGLALVALLAVLAATCLGATSQRVAMDEVRAHRGPADADGAPVVAQANVVVVVVPVAVIIVVAVIVTVVVAVAVAMIDGRPQEIRRAAPLAHRPAPLLHGSPRVAGRCSRARIVRLRRRSVGHQQAERPGAKTRHQHA